MIPQRFWSHWLAVGCLGTCLARSAVSIPINEVEEAVPAYTLPETLTLRNGQRVASARQWPERRAELLNLFEEHVYGRIPAGLPRPPGQRNVRLRGDRVIAVEIEPEKHRYGSVGLGGAVHQQVQKQRPRTAGQRHLDALADRFPA